MRTHHSISIFAVLLALTAWIASCTPSTEHIKTVAYGYSNALANYNIDDAAQYCTPETQETTLQYAKSLMANVPPEYIASDTPAEIKITEVIVDNDTTATVHYHKHTPLKDFDASLNMVRRNGQWLAHDPLQSTTEEDNRPVADTTSIDGQQVIFFRPSSN